MITSVASPYCIFKICEHILKLIKVVHLRSSLLERIQFHQGTLMQYLLNSNKQQLLMPCILYIFFLSVGVNSMLASGIFLFVSYNFTHQKFQKVFIFFVFLNSGFGRQS